MVAEFVEWDDSSSEDGPWIEPDALEKACREGSMRCFSVGYVAREDERSLTIAQSFTRDEKGEVSEWGHALTIPKPALVRRFRVPPVPFAES